MSEHPGLHPPDVDTYINERLVGDDPALDAAQARAAAAGVPAIEVAPNQGKLLHLLARMSGARRVLELGTLAGYSTIWLARALPADGRLITLEADAGYAAVAQANLEAAGLSARVEIRVGAALDTLPQLRDEGPFDFVFLDADKQRTAAYLEWALRLTRPGSVVVADNVVRGGAVADAADDDPRVQGMRRFFDLLHAASGVTATAVQTVGSKGWDGFALALVEEPATG
ncbi:Catechol O-methyltransferase [Baekduia alba]|uniref:O-methyltransferase n=1 Tax=Baekduia alba TaxID=2997333 RepID=UPI002340C94A|nr:O-methyltransferase [Baekduia alba]WCB94083.1 Catechol O-methyltransferase [Baekduia alba]